ncbi:toll-like receptor Tollo [Anopheles aquasalis]|uniref:toll-like receptor Tollo n=1 Tax=Anopheles aquasalis TaxID=42839 RepID=UPI00215AB5B5|nr:toll-like receptor Tollo [Anopheles aquasalis]
MIPHNGTRQRWWCSQAAIISLLLLINALCDATAALEQPFALLDCPPECMCERIPEETQHAPVESTSNEQSFPEVGSDEEGGNMAVHALCMVAQGSTFMKIEDLLSLDTTVLKIIYTSLTESYQLNASNLVRFVHLRELRLQSVKPHMLSFDIDVTLPVERLHLESLDLLKSEMPNVIGRTVPTLADLGLAPSGTAGDEQGASTYEIIDHSMELVANAETDESSNALIETFELEIVPYEVYKRDLASTNNISFYGWTNLTSLSIHDCKLESLHPDFLYGLEKLQRLSLQHNHLKVLPAFAFYGAPNIRILSLANNTLLEISYYSLAGLLELQVLDLSANNISKVSELTFPPFPRLAKLDLRQNPIDYVFDNSFVIANMTRSLFIGSDTVGLKVAARKPFQGLAQMELLEIRNLHQPTLTQYLFRGLSALRTLRLLEGNISFIEYDSFAEMKNLTELSAAHCAIEAISMDAFFGVKRLRTIDISFNRLTELPVGLFDELLQLVELYLQGNRLTQLPTDFFRRLAPSVALVRLTDNPWQCSCSMVQWRQAITNRMKISNVSATGGSTGSSYIYSNKLTPRCSEPLHKIQNRGVYYVIRKNLVCHTEDSKYAKMALRISELNRRKQLMLLEKRAAAQRTLQHHSHDIVQQPKPSFTNPIPHSPLASRELDSTKEHPYQRPVALVPKSMLFEQKRRRLQQKLRDKQAKPEARDTQDQALPQHRVSSNDLEY